MARGSRWQLVWFNFSQLFRWYRILGVVALSLAAYLLVFVVLKKTDVSWLLPSESGTRFRWPDLPHFFVTRENGDGRQPGETVYTVPSRQITRQELSELPATNQTRTPSTPR